MAKTQEEQMISDAMKDTEKEIFDHASTDAAADDADNGAGDRSLEDMDDTPTLEGAAAAAAEEKADAEAADEVETDAGEKRDLKTGQFKANPDAAAAKEKPAAKLDKDGKPIAAAAEEQNGRVPSSRLREETARRTAAEQERDAARAEGTAVKTDLANLNKRLDDLMGAITSGKLTGQPAKAAEVVREEQVPDIFADPEGYQRFMEDRLQRVAAAGNQNMEAMRVELSMQSAHDRLGKTFEEAYSAVTKLDPRNPNDVQTVRRIWASPNPGKALVSWHNQQRTLAEVGDDPVAYRERIAKDTRDALAADPEFLKELLEAARGSAESGGGNGRPRTVVRSATPSLNSARGGGMGQTPDRRPQDGSDAAVFDFATQP